VINFRVNQVNVANNLGAECTIGGIQLTKASLASATTVTATYAVETALGEGIDFGCADPGPPGEKRACAAGETPNRVTLANIRSQFSVKVTTGQQAYNGVIDVEQDREVFAFVDEQGGNDEDSLWITVENEGTLLEAVEPVDGMLTVSGDFSWAAGTDGKCGTGDDAGFVTSDFGDAAFSADCKSYTVDYGSFPPGDSSVPDVIVLAVPGVGSGVKLSPQTFAADYEFTYDTDGVTSIKFSAGRWTINGALIFVPYMPYSADGMITQIVYIANRGSQDGSITVDAFDEAGNSYTFDVGVVEAGTVRKLAQELLDGLTLGGFTPPGKVAFEITVTAPDKDIDLYSAYNVGGSDRGTVVNSQNGKALGCDTCNNGAPE